MPAEPAHTPASQELPVASAVSAPASEARCGWRHGSGVRIRGACIAIPIVVVLGIAAWLRPDPRGLGTHEQLHMGACGFVVNSGWPCPTCGMTTSFAACMHGQLPAAFRANAFGPVLVAGLLAMLAISAWELATGRGVIECIFWRWWWALVVIGGVLAGWGIKAYAGWIDGTYPIR